MMVRKMINEIKWCIFTICRIMLWVINGMPMREHSYANNRFEVISIVWNISRLHNCKDRKTISLEEAFNRPAK